jgi:hypothetical protein
MSSNEEEEASNFLIFFFVFWGVLSQFFQLFWGYINQIELEKFRLWVYVTSSIYLSEALASVIILETISQFLNKANFKTPVNLSLP